MLLDTTKMDQLLLNISTTLLLIDQFLSVRGKISFPDNSEFLTMLDYNSKEHKLYGWRMSDSWDGQLVTYNVHFATT